MIEYLLVLLLHASLVAGLGLWYARAYRRAVRRTRHELERMLAAARSDSLRAELEYIRRRHDVLMHGLFPRGDVFPGNFIEEDPELQALMDLVEVVRGQPLPDVVKRGT